MTDFTERFSDRVGNYVKYRPSYPLEILDLMRDRCGLTTGSIVADVGSGTGIFAQLLLKTGCRVYGIEPNAPMRQAAEAMLANLENFVSLAATAEETTLPDQSVHIITCAQAFHWFDRTRCKREFKRILKPNAWVALIWNERLIDTTPFLCGYEQLLLDYATDYEQVNHTQIDDAVLQDFFAPHTFQKYTIPNQQLFDYEGLKGRLLSSSYAPHDAHPAYQPMLEALRKLFETHQKNGLVSFDYDVNIYLSHLS